MTTTARFNLLFTLICFFYFFIKCDIPEPSLPPGITLIPNIPFDWDRGLRCVPFHDLLQPNFFTDTVCHLYLAPLLLRLGGVTFTWHFRHPQRCHL